MPAESSGPLLTTRKVKVTLAPTGAELCEARASTSKSVAGSLVTVVIQDEALFPGFGSIASLATTALFALAPATARFATIERVALAPLARTPRAALTRSE